MCYNVKTRTTSFHEYRIPLLSIKRSVCNLSVPSAHTHTDNDRPTTKHHHLSVDLLHSISMHFRISETAAFINARVDSRARDGLENVWVCGRKPALHHEHNFPKLHAEETNIILLYIESNASFLSHLVLNCVLSIEREMQVRNCICKLLRQGHTIGRGMLLVDVCECYFCAEPMDLHIFNNQHIYTARLY